MKSFFKAAFFLLVSPVFVMCSSDNSSSTPAPVTQRMNPLLADPTIFVDNGTYYLYGTKENTNIGGDGFLVYTSTDLENWTGPAGARGGFAFKKGDGYGDTGFWAPQVFKRNGKYYMAYTANEHIAIAQSDSPLGPFTNTGSAIPSDIKQIDPYVYFDEDGKVYLYHVRLDSGNRVFVAEMENDLSAIKQSTLTECIHATKPWENADNAIWTVTEGPTVFKKDGVYYMTYSANDFRSKDYAVGYATATSPVGPWNKDNGSPIISRTLLGFPGTGHGDIFYDTAGSMNYVFHTHFSLGQVGPRKTAIVPLALQNGQITIKQGGQITWPLIE